MEQFATPCSTHFVEGLFSGGLGGAVYGSALWTWKLTDGVVVLYPQGKSVGSAAAFPYTLAQSTGRGAALFAIAIATFNGAKCLTDRLAGKHIVNAGIAGAFAGHIFGDRAGQVRLKHLTETGVKLTMRMRLKAYLRASLPYSIGGAVIAMVGQRGD